jgi:hypothetical protein
MEHKKSTRILNKEGSAILVTPWKPLGPTPIELSAEVYIPGKLKRSDTEALEPMPVGADWSGCSVFVEHSLTLLYLNYRPPWPLY